MRETNGVRKLKILDNNVGNHDCPPPPSESLFVLYVDENDPSSYAAMDYSSCRMCDEPIRWAFDTENAWVSNLCNYPDGITTTVRIAVPSGKIVVDDSLRDVYDYRVPDTGDREGYVTDPEGMAGYNSILGQSQAIEAMAKLGCAYGPVGNSCPDIYDQGNGNYLIGNPGVIEGDFDEELCEYVTDDEEIPVPGGGKKIGWIVTDLWAYSIADHDDFLAKGGSLDHPCREVIEVPPGYYEFTHLTGVKGFDRWTSQPVVFATIKHIPFD